MYTRYCAALSRAGYDVSEYRLYAGDRDHAWRSMIGGTGTPGTGSYGYLGDTKATAYRSLYVMAQILEDIDYDKQRAEYAAKVSAAKEVTA
jgi:hypothetical protein